MKRIALVYEIICSLFVILFLYTGIMKLIEPGTLEFDLINLPYIKHIWKAVYIVMPAAEIVIAGLLLFTKTKSWGIRLSLLMMLLFTIYVGGILISGDKRPCSCGGVIRTMDWDTHLIFNVCFFILAIIGVILDRKMRINQVQNTRGTVSA